MPLSFQELLEFKHIGFSDEISVIKIRLALKEHFSNILNSEDFLKLCWKRTIISKESV